jgi:hypothetical protein
MNDVNDPAAKEAEGAIIAASCGKEANVVQAQAVRLVQLSGHSPPAAETLFPDAWPTAHPQARGCWSR